MTLIKRPPFDTEAIAYGLDATLNLADLIAQMMGMTCFIYISWMNSRRASISRGEWLNLTLAQERGLIEQHESPMRAQANAAELCMVPLNNQQWFTRSPYLTEDSEERRGAVMHEGTTVSIHGLPPAFNHLLAAVILYHLTARMPLTLLVVELFTGSVSKIEEETQEGVILRRCPLGEQYQTPTCVLKFARNAKVTPDLVTSIHNTDNFPLVQGAIQIEAKPEAKHGCVYETMVIDLI